ncbi:MAG: glycoside hydrolase family 38 [Rhodoferax sp.]|nr:glycoside hydrolase family 38 [Rhodoferax sp.]
MQTFEVGVVVQTHWDREWYFPHQQFVARLLRVMQHVVPQLESGALQHFLFDGQTAAMEDLLAHAEPEWAARVQALARQGRIGLGPWYVMADEFLCSGESLWRNLEIGMADATVHGGLQQVGYLPDTFGHIGQMPQILRHFGLSSAVLWRGVDTAHSEFDWVAPDGTRTGTLFLTQGYYQHPFNVRDWRGALHTYLDSIAPRALSQHLLLTQGGDHLLSSDTLAQQIADFNATPAQGSAEYHLVQSSLPDVVQKTLDATQGKRPEVVGELRQNAQAFVLPDVLSTRRYLKQWHQHAEDRLLGEIEPLFAMLQVPSPMRYLDTTWRLLIQQQAHDSICGCSVDVVHDEMETRFAQLEQRLDALRAMALTDAGMCAESVSLADALPSPFADDALCTLFNPTVTPRTGWHTVDVFLKGPLSPGLSVTDLAAEALPHQIVAVAAHREFHSPLNEFPDPVDGHQYTLAVQCDLQGLESRALRVQGSTGTSALGSGTKPLLANAQVRIECTDGRLEISHPGSPQRHALALFSELDAGDSYNYAPPADAAPRVHARFEVIGTEVSGPCKTLRLRLQADLPSQLNTERSGPSAEEVQCEGELTLRLMGESPMVQATLRWTNRAQDQRTRLIFPMQTPAVETSADSAFAWVTRPVVLAQYPKAPSRTEMPVAVNPSYSAVCAGEWNVVHRAMQEFEVVRWEDGQALAITLVRSVGWLSRRDLVTRGVGAGPDMPTPGAQCLGEQVFTFAFGLDTRPLGAERTQATLAHADCLRRPVQLLRGHSNRWHAPQQMDNPVLQVSSVRRQANCLELRVWNPTAQTQALQMREDGWVRVEGAGLQASENTLAPLEVLPFGIATFRKVLPSSTALHP